MIYLKHGIFFMDVAHVSLAYLVPFLKKSMEFANGIKYFTNVNCIHVHLDWSEQKQGAFRKLLHLRKLRIAEYAQLLYSRDSGGFHYLDSCAFSKYVLISSATSHSRQYRSLMTPKIFLNSTTLTRRKILQGKLNSV